MTPDELDKIIVAVKEGAASQVEISVNGKINKLLVSQEELKGWFKEHALEDKETSNILNGHIDTLNNYIKADEEWKIKAKPVIELGENISWSGMAFLKFLGAIGAVIAIIAGILNLTKHN